MNKLLTAGLVAAVAMTSANASQCGNGGWYVFGNFGISSNQMKYKNNLKDQKGVLNVRELPKMMRFKAKNGDADIEGYTNLFNKKDLTHNDAKLDVTNKQLKKRKGIFFVELGGGRDFRINDVMIGIEINFGKYFGNVKKKATMLVLTNYLNPEDLPYAKVESIVGCATVENIANPATASTNYVKDQAGDINANKNNRYFVKFDTIKGLTAKLYDPESEYELKMKNKYLISLMPRFGYLISSELEVYITAGVKIRSDKYTVNATMYDKKINCKKSVTKCIPAVGVGFRYEFGSGMFANLSAVHNFKSKKTFTGLKALDDTTTKHTLQASSTDIKVGFGRRF